VALLDAYRVVDFTNERGLLAGRLLADLGADVVQIEPPEGSSARRVGPFSPDGESLYWDAYAANKRGVTCDVETPAGRESALGLCAEADFVFESETPGVMARRGLAYDDVRAVNPHVVYVSITPFGSDGPKARYADSEIVLWAAGGPLAAHRDGDRPPLRVSVPQAYLHAAADAAGGALVAHLARRRTGAGQHVDVSVVQSVTQATLSRILATAVGDPQGSRLVADARTLDQSGSGSGTVATKWRVHDGYVELHLAIGPAAGRFTNNLFAWLREERGCDEQLAAVDWAEVPRLVAEGAFPLAELEHARAVVADFLARRTKRELIEAALERKLLAGPILTVADIAESPQLEARRFWVELGRVLPGPFARVSSDAFAFRRPAPRLGEHNAQVVAKTVRGIEPGPGRSPGPASRVREHALAGVRVLDLCWVVAGPAVGRVLADYGAEVVRIESSTRLDTARLIGPFHGGTQTPESSILYGDVNAGKLGLSLNLKLEPARDVVRDLVRRSDVVLDSFSPGVMESWGLGYEQLRALNESVIALSTSLMGQTGPYGRFAGYGNIGAAMSGFQSLVGWPDLPPFGPYGPYSDYVAPRFALVVLLAALDRRLDTGEGCYIDVAQVETAAHFLAPQLAD
jgi:crotonobetainyl-CoA:carnitine CoA-transferase CaiB-like acyl-CoA transferase